MVLTPIPLELPPLSSKLGACTLEDDLLGLSASRGVVRGGDLVIFLLPLTSAGRSIFAAVLDPTVSVELEVPEAGEGVCRAENDDGLPVLD